MDSCEGHLKDLYKVIGQELDKVLDETEEDSSDEWSKANLDRESDDGVQINGGESSESNSKARKWNKFQNTCKPAETLKRESTAQASVASVSEGPTKLDEFASKALGDFETFVTGSAAAMKEGLA